ncbi:MAG: tRNA lysidine(34) synthetase TilS [Gordonia sp. (in: high G+C Gram-positive bacteria)]
MDYTGALTRSVAAFVATYLDGRTDVCVGLSGGPDSVALTAAAVQAGLSVRALVVDHALQPGSADVAAAAANCAKDLGADAEVLTVTVGCTGGMEAAARAARYRALEEARGGAPVLIAHTMDDQAETVLLGLARGSGARSLAGMAPWRPPWGRPLLGVRRAQTVGACAELGLRPYADPHNGDPRFTRVRVRAEVLPLLDDVLHGGVVEALARTATGLRADNEALDSYADIAYHSAVHGNSSTSSGTELDAVAVAQLPGAVGTRVVRRWLYAAGASAPTAPVIDAVYALATGRAGGQVAVGGDIEHRLVVECVARRLVVARIRR